MEIDIPMGYRTVADIDEMMRELSATVATAPLGARVVIAADWRACGVMTAEVADRAVRMLTAPHMEIVERSALLHRADAHTSVMQVIRLVQEARFKQRMLFTDPDKMEAWLAEVLDEREQGRLKTFLFSGKGPAHGRGSSSGRPTSLVPRVRRIRS